MIELFDYQRQDVEKLSEQSNVLIVSKTTIKNFMSHVDIKTITDCWLWTGAKGGSLNYGTFAWKVKPNKFQMPAHRFAYQWVYGTIGNDLQVDHLCEVKLCVNPFHLEAVTPKINMQRSRAKITHCKSGHPFDEVNTYITPDGHRECRICRREAVRKWDKDNRKAYEERKRGDLNAHRTI